MAAQQTTQKSKYISGHHSSVLKSHTMRNAENSAAYLLPSLDALAQRNPKFVLLDVGCGPGTITISFARRYPSSHCIGVDPSSEVIDQARALAEEQGISNASFEVGDIYALDTLKLSDSASTIKADLVHAHQVLQHVGDPVAALRQMLSTTVVGGMVAVREAIFASVSLHPFTPELILWRDLWMRVARSNGHDPEMGAKLLAIGKQAGVPIENMLASSSSQSVSGDELRTWWADSWAERCIASDFPKMVVEKQFGGRDDLEKMRQGWLEWGRCDVGWYAMPQGELIIQK